MIHPPLRVLHVTTNTYVIRSFIINDLVRLRDRTDATIACADGADVATLRKEGLHIVTFPIKRNVSPIADLRAIWSLWRLLRRERFDLLHSYVPKGGVVGQIAGWLARVPSRVHSCLGLSYVETMPAWRRLLVRTTDRLTNALAHRTLFVSHADFDFAIRTGLCPRSSARHIGNGIDLAYYDPDRHPPDLRDRARRRLGVSNNAPVILTVGRFVADKGYHELASAAETILGTHPDARFVWVAPVVDDEDAVVPKELVERPELRGSITVLPMQDDVRPLYAAADVLAHPSYREGVPRVLIEAAAMRLPIIACDIPGCREVVTHGATAVLCPPRDAEALAERVLLTLRDLAGASRRAAAANEDVRKRFDQDALTDRIRELYQELSSVPVPAVPPDG